MPFQAYPILEAVYDDAEYSTARYVQRGDHLCVMVVTPSRSIDPSVASPDFEHTYFFKEELARSWAASPLEIVREDGKPSLVVEHPGGELIAQMFGSGWE